jgi:hypothetical protein
MKKLLIICITIIFSGCGILKFNNIESLMVFQSNFIERPVMSKIKHTPIPKELKQHIPESGEVILIDYSQSSSKKRLWVVQDGNVVINCRVGHGKNSGWNFSTKFSNKHNSNMSCIGKFITGNEYTNSVIGRAMNIYGLEDNVNDNVYQRGIRFHSSKYASDSYFKRNGRIGRSLGCFTTDKKYNNQIIDLCKIGTIIYVIG